MRCLTTHPGVEMKAKEATRLRIQGTFPGSSHYLLVAWEAPRSPRSPWPPGRPGNGAMLAATDGMGSGHTPCQGRGLNPAWSLCSLPGCRALPSPPPHSSLYCSVVATALQQAVSLSPTLLCHLHRSPREVMQSLPQGLGCHLDSHPSSE